MIRLNGQISHKRLTGRAFISKLSDVKIALQEKSVTPSTVDQVIEYDDGYDGLKSVTVDGDENLIPENIKFGKIIFGVEGTNSGGSMFDTIARGALPVVYQGNAYSTLGFDTESTAVGAVMGG